MKESYPRLLQLDGITVELTYSPAAPALQELLMRYIANISPLPEVCADGTIEA